MNVIVTFALRSRGKSILFALLLTLSALQTPQAGAQQSDQTPSAGGNAGAASGRDARHGGKRLNPSAPTKNPGTIRGTCVVDAGTTNPLAGPCVNVLLILNGTDGTEVEKTRTNSTGKFEFAGEKKVSYLIVPGSKFYDVTSPTKPIHGGDKVELHLLQH